MNFRIWLSAKLKAFALYIGGPQAVGAYQPLTYEEEALAFCAEHDYEKVLVIAPDISMAKAFELECRKLSLPVMFYTVPFYREAEKKLRADEPCIVIMTKGVSSLGLRINSDAHVYCLMQIRHLTLRTQLRGMIVGSGLFIHGTILESKVFGPGLLSTQKTKPTEEGASPFPAIDKRIRGGFKPGELVVFAGTKTGRTTSANSQSTNSQGPKP